MRITSCLAAGWHLAGARDGIQKASQKVFVLENSIASSHVGHAQA